MTRGHEIFMTGGTGYIGRRLIPLLLARGHRVRALVRHGSERKLPEGAEPIVGDALEAASFADRVAPADTFIQLVGVAHPSPAKAALFRSVDLASARASVDAAARGGAAHFVYVSVARPAPVMQAYQAARAAAEEAIASRGLDATILRPWYVLGPGHRWPVALLPFYAIAGRIPALRESANRLRPVRLGNVLAALVLAVESPARGIRILETADLRAARL
ncbi:MAG TPA: NAD(P)H-binding protein [Thermoanaerobaculia bacterium]|jgi:uncharacterized protein YbjT (DUF2867 family)